MTNQTLTTSISAAAVSRGRAHHAVYSVAEHVSTRPFAAMSCTRIPAFTTKNEKRNSMLWARRPAGSVGAPPG